MMPQGGHPQPNYQGYDPDYFEYDDELPEGQMGERVILSDEQVPREIGIIRTIGTMKVNEDYNEEEFYEWAEENDEDDARIEAFLESHKPKPKVCAFFQTNSCRNGKSCSFPHVLDASAAVHTTNARFNADDDAECQICLEKVLAQGR